MSARTFWTEPEVRALGVRTDLVSACEIVYGCGRTKAYELMARGELDFPVFKARNRYSVPVAPLLEMLGLSSESEDRAPTRSNAPLTDEVTGGPRHDHFTLHTA